MDRKEVYEKLTTLTEDELYYKKCYESNKKAINRSPHASSSLLAESEWFASDYVNTPYLNIRLQKHECYSPTHMHSHDFFEFFYILNGEVEQEISRQKITFKTGDFCMIAPGVMHHISINDSTTLINILIRRSTFEKTFAPILERNNILSMFLSQDTYSALWNGSIIFHTGHSKSMSNLILDMLVEYEEQKPYYEMILDSQLSLFFNKLLRNFEKTCEFTPFSYDTTIPIFEMMNYIREHYQAITLIDLAKQFRYSPSYVSRVIHKATGKSFSKVVTGIRMEQASKLLINTTMTIADISYAVGYAATEHFIRTFKKIYSTTPSQYRKDSQ